MRIAIIQPTPFRKGHYFIYTKSLFNEIKKKGFSVKIISAAKIYNTFFNEEKSKFDFKIYSFRGLIIYLFLCIITIFRFFWSRNKFNKIIILDCEYTCVSILLIILKLFNWKGKITLQINAPNFGFNYKDEDIDIFKILKFIQSYIFRSCLDLFDLKISCLGKWHKQKLSQQLRIKQNKILIIEDGGGESFKKLSRKTLVNNLKSNSIVCPTLNKKIFLLFGNMRRDKGHLFLSSLWSDIFCKPDDPYLWIVGHDEEKISDKILKNFSPNIVIHNSYIPLELIKCIYQFSDFAILPYLSNYVGGSGPLMKGAFTHSKLALVSNVSEMGRLAKEEKLAEYFEAENPDSLLACIKRVLENGPEFYSEVINGARDYSKKRNWSNLTNKFLKSFE